MTRDREGGRERLKGHDSRKQGLPQGGVGGVGGLGAAKPLPPAASPRRRPGPDSGPKPPANAEKAKQKIQGRRRPAAQAAKIKRLAEATSQRRKKKKKTARHAGQKPSSGERKAGKR